MGEERREYVKVCIEATAEKRFAENLLYLAEVSGIVIKDLGRLIEFARSSGMREEMIAKLSTERINKLGELKGLVVDFIRDRAIDISVRPC